MQKINPIYPKVEPLRQNPSESFRKEIMDSVYMTLSKKYIDNNYQKAEELSTDLQKTREKKTDFLRLFTVKAEKAVEIKEAEKN